MIPFSLVFTSFIEFLPYLSFFLILTFVFLIILFSFGILYLIEGITRIIAVRKGATYNSFLFTYIITTSLIIVLIGSFNFYFIYINNNSEGNIGPYLSWSDEDTSSTVTITWETNYSEPNPILRWGNNKYEVNRIAKVEGDYHHHTVKLKGLKSNSTYYYQIPGFYDKITQFKTGPIKGYRDPFSFLFYGDSREDKTSVLQGPHDENIELMVKEKNVKFVLQAGDIANNLAANWKEQWDYSFHVTESLSNHMPYMPVEGNHDVWDEDKNPEKKRIFSHYYELPKNDPSKDENSYWFYYGNVFVLVLGYDDEESACPAVNNSEIVEWVTQMLQYAKNSGLFDWIFVMNHVPAFSIKMDNDICLENNTQIRYWHPIFMENGVDFVLNGHNHHYERVTMGYTPENIKTHNISYVVSGAGGGGSELHGAAKATFNSESDPVGDLIYYGQTDCIKVTYHYVKFSVDGPKLTLTAITEEGDIIERHTFSK